MTNSIKPVTPPSPAMTNANTYSDPNGLAALKKDPKLAGSAARRGTAGRCAVFCR